MRKVTLALLALSLLVAAPRSSRAGDDIQLDPTEMSKGFQKEAVGQLDDAAQKLTELAEAMPESRYAWRPGKGVRSVSEVFRHVAAANYQLGTFLGVKIPDGLEPAKFEKTPMTKAEIVDLLKKSFVHARRVMASLTDEQLREEVPFFGQPSTRHGVMLTMVSHAHEHLGQSIAYARINRVVPPWTARADAELAKSKGAATPN